MDLERPPPGAARSGLYCIMIFLLMMMLSDKEDPRARLAIEEALNQSQVDQIQLLNMTWNEELGEPINLLSQPFKEFSKQVFDSMHRPDISRNGVKRPPLYYSNATGVFRGEWIYHDLPGIVLNESYSNHAKGLFNWTSSGSLKFALSESSSKIDGIQMVDGTLRLVDKTRNNIGMQIFLEGLHFIETGNYIMTGVAEKHHISLASLANYSTSEQQFNDTKSLILDELDERIQNYKNLLSSQFGIGEIYIPPNSHETFCDFIVFSQMHQLPPDIDAHSIKELEQELQNPEGISIIPSPPLRMTILIYSRKCGFTIAIKDANGLKVEKYNNKATNYAAMVIMIAIIQIWLLISQMQYTATPSSISKVSYWTIMLQAAIDGYLCVFHITVGIRTEIIFIAFSTCAFLFCVLVSIFGMRYLLIIWRVQRPENIPRRNTSTSPAISSTAQATILPGPVTATTPTPVNVEENTRRNISLLYARFYIFLIIGLVFFAQTSTLPLGLQNFLNGTVAFFLYSFWVPQLWRNAKRGSRKGLSMKYIIGMSFTRLFIPLYVGLCPENILGYELTEWIWVLVGWVWLQMLFLLTSEFLGPRFFIPERFLPSVYEYHPILTSTNDLEYAGFTNGVNDETVDCAICMQRVEIPANAKTNVLARMGYMLTPCHHLMHTECLERWMNIRLECPVCRSPLPPL